MVHRSGMSRRVIVCVECGAMSATPSLRGWRGYRIDDPEDEEPPALAFYCPSCAVTEAGGRPTRLPPPNRGRRFRDAHKPSAGRFRVTLETAVALVVADAELASTFDVVTSAGGLGLSVLRGGDAEPTRVEFDLEAQNDGHAARLARELLEALAAVTPSVPGGWVSAPQRCLNRRLGLICRRAPLVCVPGTETERRVVGAVAADRARLTRFPAHPPRHLREKLMCAGPVIVAS